MPIFWGRGVGLHPCSTACSSQAHADGGHACHRWRCSRLEHTCEGHHGVGAQGRWLVEVTGAVSESARG
eukprot:9341697-Alexandrium_andersonii.AAC.1